MLEFLVNCIKFLHVHIFYMVCNKCLLKLFFVLLIFSSFSIMCCKIIISIFKIIVRSFLKNVDNFIKVEKRGIVVRAKNFLISIFLFILFVSLYWCSVRTQQGQIIDVSILYAHIDYSNILKVSAYTLLTNATKIIVICGVVIIVLIGVFKKKYKKTLLVVFLILFSNICTQVFKHFIFSYPDFSIVYSFKNSYPSGHVTLIASVMFGFILIMPTYYKNLMRYISLIFIILFSVSVCVASWHKISDVVGSLLLTTGIYLLFVSIFTVNVDNSFHSLNGKIYKYKYSLCSIFLGVLCIVALYLIYFESLEANSRNSVQFFEITSSFAFSVLAVCIKLLLIIGVSFCVNNLVTRAGFLLKNFDGK